MENNLRGRTAVVTGGSRGVGRAIALRLAGDGAAVAVNYRRDADAADEVVQEIRSGGGTAAAFCASIEDREAIETMVADVRSELGAISIIVSNAGSASSGASVTDTSDSEYEKLMRVHAFGPIALFRAALPDLRAATRGDIVATSSITVGFTPANAAPYTMAKAAMETCIRTIAREERRHGVHANVVAPGLVATEMGRRLVKATTDRSITEMDDSAPFGRVCRPEDVAAVVAFLVSGDAGYLTGQIVNVDAGGPDVSLF